MLCGSSGQLQVLEVMLRVTEDEEWASRGEGSEMGMGAAGCLHLEVRELQEGSPMGRAGEGH